MELAASLQLSSAARGILQMNPGPSSSFRKLLQPIAMEVPANETRYFDQNIAVILAAMVCAVISALGLVSMVRCALRCGRREPEPDAPGHVTVRLASAGLEKAAIQALPTVVFAGASPGLPKARAADCPICLAEFAEGETVRVLPPCSHCFHVDCIDTWLLSHTSCPSCRHSLLNVQKAEDASCRHNLLNVQAADDASCRHNLLNVQAADDAGSNSWVVAIHQSSVAGGADASLHVEKPSAVLQSLPRESPHRFLP